MSRRRVSPLPPTDHQVVVREGDITVIADQEDLEVAADGLSTALRIVEYLKTHRPNRERPRLDFLLADLSRSTWLVRWPNGSLKWETSVGLHGRGFSVPTHPLIEHGAFRDPTLAKEIAALMERR